MTSERCETCGGSIVLVETLDGYYGVGRSFQCIACSRPLERPATPVEDGLLYEEKQVRRRPRVGGQLI